MVPLEVTDALLDELHRLAVRHQHGLLVEHVMGPARHELTLVD